MRGPAESAWSKAAFAVANARHSSGPQGLPTGPTDGADVLGAAEEGLCAGALVGTALGGGGLSVALLASDAPTLRPAPQAAHNATNPTARGRPSMAERTTGGLVDGAGAPSITPRQAFHRIPCNDATGLRSMGLAAGRSPRVVCHGEAR
jgi:hypothetical protein